MCIIEFMYITSLLYLIHTRILPCMYVHKDLSCFLEWYWKVKIRDWVLKSIAIILFIFTIVIVWSEGTFGIPLPNRQHLSIIANVVYAAHNNANYVIVEV